MKSWICDPELGSKRSIQTERERTVVYDPVHDVVTIEGTQVGLEVVRPSITALGRADLERDPLEPWKSVIVPGSTSNPANGNPVNGSVIDGSPGPNVWMTTPGAISRPPGIGFGAGATTTPPSRTRRRGREPPANEPIGTPTQAFPAAPATNLRRPISPTP